MFTGRRLIEWAAKPAAIGVLGLVAMSLDAADSTQQAWFVAAVAFSFFGDVFLMLPREQFVAGLASFLVAHVAYVVGMAVTGDVDPIAFAFAAVLISGVAVGVGGKILRAVQTRQPDLVGPVGGYVVVISTMVAVALASGSIVAFVGASLFYTSDALIAWNRFVVPFPLARLAIIVTYHVGQALLVLSLV